MSPQRRSTGGGRGVGGGMAGRTGRPGGTGAGGGTGRGRNTGTTGSGGRGGGTGKPGARPKPPPTRMRPDYKPPRKVSGDKRGKIGRSGSSSRKSVGGEQVEGRHAVRELLIAGNRKVQEIWIAGDAEDAPILSDIRELAEAGRVPVRDVGRNRFLSQARCEAPQGVLAMAAPLPEAQLDDLVAGTSGRSGSKSRAPFLVALDGVTDPGNLGAVLRSAECAGATGVVLPRHRAVHVTPAATKAAAGAAEHLPIAVVGGLPAALAKMRDAGVLVIGLDGAATTSLYDMPPVDGPVCLVLGAEGRGLSRLVRERCDEVVSIPLSGRLASLNVSAAAALACFEIARNR